MQSSATRLPDLIAPSKAQLRTGVSRSVSNLGSSLGVAIAGSLVAGVIPGGGQYFYALVIVGGFAIVGWVAALLALRSEPGTAGSDLRR
jgi:hypothetical protein